MVLKPSGPQLMLTVWDKSRAKCRIVPAVHGRPIREALLAQGLSPHGGGEFRMHCHGLGICGTCRVSVREGGRWQLKRSCEIRCFQDMEIQLEWDTDEPQKLL